MSATFQWSESNGATPTVTDGLTNCNFGSHDSPDLNTSTYPIIAGQNSFFKAIRAKFTGIGTSISNMLFWKYSGAYVTGELIVCTNQSAYIQPDTAIHSAWGAVPTDEGSALVIHADDGIATDITVDGYTEYIFLQTQTTGSTPSGAVNTKTFVFQYDEV